MNPIRCAGRSLPRDSEPHSVDVTYAISGVANTAGSSVACLLEAVGATMAYEASYSATLPPAFKRRIFASATAAWAW